MSTKRELFVRAASTFVGEPVVMGGLDCSDLVARARFAIGIKDETKTHRAQTYADENPAPALLDAGGLPITGELLFYGTDWKNVVHIAIAAAGGHVISADGATSAVKTLADAVAHESARVRLHAANNWRADFLGARHHTEVDN